MKVDADIQAILARGEYDGSRLTIHEQLARPVYARFAKVIAAAGGRWQTPRRRIDKGWFDFGQDSALDALETAFLTGEITDARRDFDAFYTPAEVRAEMFLHADCRPEHDVLEPSAGGGDLALPLIAAGCDVVMVEIREDAAKKLRALTGEVVICDDFLNVAPTEFDMPGEWVGVDRVVMNPPFSRRQDLAHIQHAWKFVRPGGRLVSILSASLFFRQDRRTIDFKAWVLGHRSRMWELQPDAFKSAGTSVRTAMLVMDKAA